MAPPNVPLVDQRGQDHPSSMPAPLSMVSAWVAARNPRIIVGSAVLDKGSTIDGPGQQVDLDATLQPSGAAIGAIPAPTPGAGEHVGQADGGAIVDPDAGEALEQRDGHGIRRDDLLGDPLGGSR